MSARLLRQTSSSTVAQVAYSVGLSDLSYFHCPFRRRFDITPGDFYSHDLES
ncbi:AraC family transcriptional regulator [Alcaligenes faecalis]